MPKWLDGIAYAISGIVLVFAVATLLGWQPEPVGKAAPTPTQPAPTPTPTPVPLDVAPMTERLRFACTTKAGIECIPEEEVPVAQEWLDVLWAEARRAVPEPKRDASAGRPHFCFAPYTVIHCGDGCERWFGFYNHATRRVVVALRADELADVGLLRCVAWHEMGHALLGGKHGKDGSVQGNTDFPDCE